ncbi:MAG: hypothetical protein E6J04_06365 [Chloroflexi bacterium]|nr:MAG: hypothetical protein E6J04_06365 [Chloroflexota bacterium]
MNVDDIHDVVAVLLRRLEPVERAELLSDTIEGLHPLARKAAVLIGFFERDGEPTVIFIRRASTVARLLFQVVEWSRQIAPW